MRWLSRKKSASALCRRRPHQGPQLSARTAAGASPPTLGVQTSEGPRGSFVHPVGGSECFLLAVRALHHAPRRFEIEEPSPAAMSDVGPVCSRWPLSCPQADQVRRGVFRCRAYSESCFATGEGRRVRVVQILKPAEGGWTVSEIELHQEHWDAEYNGGQELRGEPRLSCSMWEFHVVDRATIKRCSWPCQGGAMMAYSSATATVYLCYHAPLLLCIISHPSAEQTPLAARCNPHCKVFQKKCFPLRFHITTNIDPTVPSQHHRSSE